ncbi:MAG: deoxyribodipyrimidine photolyase [Rhodobiaceae bacterium]|nr:deoxyribodipyrimidine photolyase [Rhodobiaceae bacterium]
MSLNNANTQYFEATRIAGETSLKTFTQQMGKRYTNGRNFDRGAGQHRDVSMLSPYVRRRLVLEPDLVNTAIEAHGFDDAEKFIHEVFWRSYFKGWLERRPIIWDLYKNGLIQDLELLNRDRSLRKRVEAAEAGQTGLDYFDSWAEELVETGYLHNHARMWFASIWIFSLELPWRLGADFFFRHLLDGDPASNTLGWRWVAGLHTRGKPYQAQAWNIAKFTNNRFDPRPKDLLEVVEGLENEEPEGLPDISPLRILQAPDPNRPTVLLITEEDCRPEDFDLSSLNLKGCATLTASHLRSPLSVSPLVEKFEQGALGDTASRNNLDITELWAGVPSDLAQWASRAGANQIVTPFIPIGPLRDWILEATPCLDEAGIEFVEWRRDWDDAIWRYTTAGFFKVKKKIPSILQTTGVI